METTKKDIERLEIEIRMRSDENEKLREHYSKLRSTAETWYNIF